MKNYYDFHEVVYRHLKDQGELEAWDDPETTEYLRTILKEWMPQAKGKQALDLGCGTGTSAFTLAKLGFAVTGVDISETALSVARELAQKQGLQIDFKKADVLKLGELNQSFDLVYDSHCLHCIVFDEDRKQVLTGVKESLTDSGVFILDTMATYEGWDATGDVDSLKFDEDYILWDKTEPSECYGVVKDGDDFWCAQRRIYPPEKIIEEVESVGFKVLAESLDEQEEDQPDLLCLVLGKA